VGVACAPITDVVGEDPADEQAAAMSMRVAAPASDRSLVLGRICVS
jgi:hypothetical protein